MTPVVALVTGASSGIGRETALALAARGVKVYAAARRDMADLGRRGIRTVQLDVTNDESMRGCVETVLSEQAHIDILVNNAGYGSYGAIEDVAIDEARRQFEVNVFGAMRVAQLILPTMIGQGSGRIINVSSMGGRFSMALGGWYHATKYALEAVSDALRQEVRGFGVDVVLIEPGLIHTEWPKIAADHLRTASGLGRYADIANSFAAGLEFTSRGFATDPAVIARVIANAATGSRRPRTRYRAGLGAVPLTTLVSLLPDRVYDAAIRLFLKHAGDLLSLVRDPVPESR